MFLPNICTNMGPVRRTPLIDDDSHEKPRTNIFWYFFSWNVMFLLPFIALSLSYMKRCVRFVMRLSCMEIPIQGFSQHSEFSVVDLLNCERRRRRTNSNLGSAEMLTSWNHVWGLNTTRSILLIELAQLARIYTNTSYNLILGSLKIIEKTST